jgi:hypothetical protein
MVHLHSFSKQTHIFAILLDLSDFARIGNLAVEQTLFALVGEADWTGSVDKVASDAPEFGFKDIGRTVPVDLGQFSFPKNLVRSLLSFIGLDWRSNCDLNPPILF